MKKVLLMLVLVAGFAMSIQAQAYFYDADDAVELLKEDVKSLQTMTVDATAPADLTQQQFDAILLRKAKVQGGQNLIDLIPTYGNNASTVDLAFEDAFFSQQHMTQAIVAEAKEHVLAVVSK